MRQPYAATHPRRRGAARLAPQTARARWIALVLAGAVATGCGGPSDEERRSGEARYTRAAESTCERTNRAVARHEQRPKNIDRLVFSIERTRASLTDGYARLHRLHDRLGDASSSEIDAFDRALDPFLTAIDALTVRVLDDDLARAAADVRRRGDTLHRAARAAGLRSCGRGGNAIAERAVFVVYRRGYTNADLRSRRSRANARRLSARDGSSYNRRINDALRRLYDDTGRLTPPTALRGLHQRVRRSLAALLARAPNRTLSFAEYQRVQPLLRRYARDARQLRAKLDR